MAKKDYEWKRFWCPGSGRINLADGGYLCDPDGEWGRAHNPDLVSLEAIAEIPCLVLLGEPGIGKSQELENLKALTENNSSQVLELNLRSCTNLKEDLFKDETFTDWLGGNYHLYLFLDSLDEGLLSIPTLATGLIDELRKPKYRNHINRLQLRLACRTFVFPEILEEGLKELWKEASFAIYELAPLRRIDVSEAAREEGFSSDDFLKKIDQKDIVPLAIKPITLRFLLNTYRRHSGQFPSNQRLHELYLEGCKVFCEEINESRRGSNRIGNLDTEQRLIVAARIAAVTIFANRFAIWTGIDQGDIPAEDVFLQRLYFGCEKANGREVEVTRETLKEVLDTGLLSSRRVIEGAKKYVQQQDDVDYGWIGTNTFNRPALAGCRAFLLLLQESTEFLENLPSEIWQRWASVIVAAPNSNQHEGFYLKLVKYAYLNAPEEFIKMLITLINKENQEHDYLFVTDRLDKCWDQQLKLTLLEKVKDPLLKPKCVGQLLEELLKQGLAEAGDFAKSLITSPLPSSENEREKALIAARVLVENSNPSSWSFIWALIQEDPSFGRGVLERVAYRYSHGIQLNLTEVQLADLYIWLVHQYPYDEDPDHSNELMAYDVTARDGIARLRDGVLSQLKERGTPESCARIQRLIQELPDIIWLGKTLIDAQANMRRKTWQPPTPEEFLQFVNKQQLNQFQGVTNVTNFNFDQRGANIGVNVANEGSNIKFIQHARQNINISEQDLAESAQKIQALLNQLAQAYPITTEQQQQTFIQKFLEQVESTPNLIQVFLAGGIEGLKILCPPAGIPIEVLRRLYEVVKERHNKA